jgi:hypothetical protein
MPCGSRDNIRNILSQTKAICAASTAWILAAALRPALRNPGRQIARWRCSTLTSKSDRFPALTGSTTSLNGIQT